jgi:transposase-like protein
MYVQGVSTRRVKKIVKELCGTGISSTQVSRAANELDGLLESRLCRDLDRYPYLVVDARYEKVRQGGQVPDAAVLIACGVDDQGNRDVPGCSVSLSEAEVHWRSFLTELKDRGLCGVDLIVSDAHEGLKAARKAVFQSVPRQRDRHGWRESAQCRSNCRCQFHLQQNAGQYVKKNPCQARQGLSFHSAVSVKPGRR